MKILLCYYTHKPGGLCHRQYRLMRALAQRGHEVHYLTLDAPPEEALVVGVQVKYLRFPLSSRKGVLFWCLFALSASFQLSTLLRTGAYQRLVLFHPFYVFLSFLGVASSSTQLVLLMRALPDRIATVLGRSQIRVAAERWILRWACQRAQHLIALSGVMAKELALLTGRDDIRVIPNDLPKLTTIGALPGSESRPLLRLLSSGVLDQRKNVGLILDALAELRSRMGGSPQIQLLIAGTGPQLAQLKAKAVELGISDSVLFLGWVPDLAQRLATVDLVLQSSLHEGMSNSLLEGLAAGKIVLASRIPEHLELLEKDELLFDPRQPRELAEVLRRVLEEEGYPDRLRRYCQERAQVYTFPWDEQVAACIEG